MNKIRNMTNVVLMNQQLNDGYTLEMIAQYHRCSTAHVLNCLHYLLVESRINISNCKKLLKQIGE